MTVAVSIPVSVVPVSISIAVSIAVISISRARSASPGSRSIGRRSNVRHSDGGMRGAGFHFLALVIRDCFRFAERIGELGDGTHVLPVIRGGFLGVIHEILDGASVVI